MKRISSFPDLHILVLCSGMAALSWEVLWQIKSTLALGVSAWGTALTLAATMGGMSAGALLMGYALRHKTSIRPLRLYAFLECLIGLAGLCLGPAFWIVEAMDTHIYATAPAAAPLAHILSIVAVLGIPTLSMGATLPVLGLAARQFRTSLALIYGLNTLGAAAGVMIAAFLLIPMLGITGVTFTMAAVNFVVGFFAWRLDAEKETFKIPPAKTTGKNLSGFSLWQAILIVAVTGFATFALEIAWFRSLTAAFMSSTDSFAIMLASVLLSLAASAWLVPSLKKRGWLLSTFIVWAGIFILLFTPVIERFDIIVKHATALYPFIVFAKWFGITLYFIGIPMLLLGIALPWILDEQSTPRRWGLLYGLNALAAIIGSLSAAWIFLPSIGFARTAWIAGGLVLCAGLLVSPAKKRLVFGMTGIAALILAVVFESGVGKIRIQGPSHYNIKDEGIKVLDAYESPDVTASVIELPGGRRALYIDGFSATEQAATTEKPGPEHYMAWMGHMPMLLHPGPKRALVICFGTGQTANAVREENPQSLDIVDINANVFKLAHHFSANKNVLGDPRVTPVVMDGRAYIRRTDKKYDVITLEPMPPNFAGVNALYSQEFYQRARNAMTSEGIIAQWLPFHLMAPEHSASIAKTFQSVFPNSILWIDPPSTTGILLGSADENYDLTKNFPGFRRMKIKRSMSEEAVKNAVLLNPEKLRAYGENGWIITDDNQLLAYGSAAHMLYSAYRDRENASLLEHAAKGP
ncbi:MAG: fused MFS/spermidine synthase [Alphaproteobacteria bacterium]|nr:fused MFS/spermidine synthase [Alphaproteobacteria bacterium]